MRSRAAGEENGEVNFHGERRSNSTHQSTTDPEARLYKSVEGQRSQTQLLGPRADGESPGVAGEDLHDAGQRHSGTRRGDGSMAKKIAGSKRVTLGRQ